jgi:hypothetical protein
MTQKTVKNMIGKSLKRRFKNTDREVARNKQQVKKEKARKKEHDLQEKI